jgi:hypothetical protein
MHCSQGWRMHRRTRFTPPPPPYPLPLQSFCSGEGKRNECKIKPYSTAKGNKELGVLVRDCDLSYWRG